MKLTLHFKRRKQEGLPPQPFFLTTTSTPATAQSMCSSPSHPQQPLNSPKDPLPPLEQNDDSAPEGETLDSISPATNPDHHPNHTDHRQKSDLGLQNDAPGAIEDDPEEEEPEEDQEDRDLERAGENLSAFPPPLSSVDALVDHPDHVSMMSTTPHHKRTFNKRKKGKGSVKKQQAIEKKLQTLMENLNPIPFIPSKILDFGKHEKLLRKLGLWDFFHISFDRSVRADLVAQLVATYDPKLRCSYVNDFRIAVNRADLGRAFKLPVKKEKAGSSDGPVDLELEALSDESIGFLEGFVSNWVLLHEDTWMMPNEVLNWTKAIKDGHPEKVDWAGLFWFMVEKELLKGEQLVDCYYASHLQYLIKSQREEAMVRKPEDGGDLNADELVLQGEPDRVDLDAEEEVANEEQDRVDMDAEGEVVGEEEKSTGELDAEKEVLKLKKDGVEFDAELKEENGGDVKMNEVQENEVDGPNVELTLGKEVEEKEETRDDEMMDVQEGDEQEELDQRQWLLNGKSDVGEHFLQRCNVEVAQGFDSFQERKEVVDELEGGEEEGDEQGEEEEDGFEVEPSDDPLGGDGLTSNFLKAMETNQIGFGSQAGHLHDESSFDLIDNQNELQAMDAEGLPFYCNNVKREFDHEHDILHHSQNGGSKRLRIDGPWDRPMDFGTCVEQMQQTMVKARMLYEEKEQALGQANMHQQTLLNEIQKRDSVIEHLHEVKFEEIQKRDAELHRLQRELFLMGNLLDDYRKALKRTNKAFTEYREKCQLPEEPIYEDAGPGGVVLSVSEIEKQRLKEEEEYKANCMMLEQKAKEVEEGYALNFGDYLNQINSLDKRLADIEKGVKELRELYSKPKVPESEQHSKPGVPESEQNIGETSDCPFPNAKEVEEGYTLIFGNCLDKINSLDKRLADIEKRFKELRELYSKPKVPESELYSQPKAPESEQNIGETSECPPPNASECPPSE